MRPVNAFAVAATVTFGLVTGFANPALAQITALQGARVIDGTGQPPIENATIIVDSGKIVRIARGADVSIPQGATVVNVSGKTIMPAIIDTHTHLSTTKEGVEQDLRRRAYFGVSAAQSMGTDPLEMLAVRKDAGGGGRYFSAGRGITRPEPMRPTYFINSEAEARTAVKELAARNVDIVKVWVDDRNGTVMKVTPAQYTAIIDEAHKNGLRVTAHIFTLEDAKGLLRANLDAFAHSVRDKDVDDEFMTLVKAKPNLVVNPNLPNRGAPTDISFLQAALPPAQFQMVQAANVANAEQAAAHAIQARNLKKLIDANVEIVVGTDGNTPWAPHIEMEDMVLAGMTPMQVILAATRDAAQFLRMPDSGQIVPGRNADLLVLDANPLDDIKNTRKISAVYLRGVAVDRSKYQ